MFCSDIDIEKLLDSRDLIVKPLMEDSLRPGSIIMHLSHNFRRFENSQKIIDPLNPSSFPKTMLEVSPQGLILQPNELVLGATMENVALSKSILGHLSNISGLARLGLSVALSTHVAPGFGTSKPRPITLEIHNLSGSSIWLRPGMRVCHLIVGILATKTSLGYDEKFPKKYQDVGPGISEFSK